jgi:hypothetical protein
LGARQMLMLPKRRFGKLEQTVTNLSECVFDAVN